MSSSDSLNQPFLRSTPLANEAPAETSPLLSQKSYNTFRSTESQSEGTTDVGDEEFQKAPSELIPTLPLLLKQFKVILNSSLPVFGTQLLEYALLMTSVLAVGHLGKIELASCTLGSMTANVTSFSIVIGMAGALDTVLPGVWGASASTSRMPGRRKDSNVADSRLLGLWCQRMAVLYLLLLIPILTIWLHAEEILLLLRQDEEVARLAGRYLAMLALGMPAFSFNTVAKRYFQAQGLFSIPTKIGTAVAAVNVLLTVVLVYYPDPLPRAFAPYLHLGFDGAPLATAISYNLITIGFIFWGCKIENDRKRLREMLEAEEEEREVEISTPTNRHSYFDSPSTPVEGSSSAGIDVTVKSISSARSSLDLDRRSETVGDSDESSGPEIRSAWYPLSLRALHPTGLGTLLTLGLGGVGQTASEWWAWELIGLAASLFGPTALAAQSVLVVTASTSYQIPYALGVATSVIIGQHLGLARPRSAKMAAYAALMLGLAMSLTFSMVCWIWRKKWGYIFNDDEDVNSMVANILPLVAALHIFDANSAITGGILRARGKQGISALFNLSAYYIVGVPLALYLAFKDIGFPESLPDHPVVTSLSKRFMTMLPPSSISSLLPTSSYFPSISTFSSFAIASHATIETADDIVYPSLPEATAGLRGLWNGLTVALIYCSVCSTILCLKTKWDYEVEKVRARVQEEERHNRIAAERASQDASDGATFVESS
ncbi:hypothetical protein GYMLUDRAFT_262756 [Collybiopsis luxurians FD-317 M1]|uniref:MATE efflux family protein n=1 Tax=Collybiopsis luxurians FD-317 M1 TaxID=944289 RepID=A0A0D0CQW3_9AGAR|nr:hypothetical protein GYMLUDRAFT_262756 [Collybiopsis luxurians FD-317 M1]